LEVRLPFEGDRMVEELKDAKTLRGKVKPKELKSKRDLSICRND
jgi:hypothetical protein